MRLGELQGRTISTQESNNHPLLDDLHGPGGEVVDGRDHVAGVHQVLVRGAEGGLDGQRDGLEAALGRRLEQRQPENLLVQVQAEVSPELLGVVGEDLAKLKMFSFNPIS